MRVYGGREKRESVLNHTPLLKKCVDELTQKLTKAQATRRLFHETLNKDHAFFFSLSLSLSLFINSLRRQRPLQKKLKKKKKKKRCSTRFTRRSWCARAFVRSFVLVFFYLSRVVAFFARVVFSLLLLLLLLLLPFFFIVLCLSR